MRLAVGRAANLADGTCKAVVVPAAPPDAFLADAAGDRKVALCRVGGKTHAVTNVCPHQGGPLGEGYMEGATLTCPWHGWRFDVTTGRSTSHPEITIPSYPVTQEGDQLFLEVP